MKYDILTVTEEALSIEVTAGKITSYRNKNITKKGIRLFDGNKFYTSSFVGDITDDDLLAKANASKSIGIDFDYNLPSYKNYKIIYWVDSATERILVSNIFDTRQNPKKLKLK